MAILGVMLGGAIGAAARYGVATLFVFLAPNAPLVASSLGTLFVNVLGSFLLGVVSVIATARGFPESLTVPLAAGFLGSLTTFSTFAFESHRWAQEGQALWMVAYVITSVTLGLLAVQGGRSLAVA